MTRIDILNKEIEDLEERIFYLNMKDRWTIEDFELKREMLERLNNLKNILKYA